MLRLRRLIGLAACYQQALFPLVGKFMCPSLSHASADGKHILSSLPNLGLLQTTTVLLGIHMNPSSD